MEACFGIDIGTTSVAGVAVGIGGKCLRAVTRAHGADCAGLPEECHEQEPGRLLSAVRQVLSDLEASCGRPQAIGWTGQMHGVVGVDADLRPITKFVTWRDGRRYGGRVMSDWHARGIRPHKCLPICALALGEAVIDGTFLHSWYLDEPGLSFPREWLPDVADGRMLGDNQAGVYAAQRLFPGCAVVNLGTSGQLSVVRDVRFGGRALPGVAAADGSRRELRPYPQGKTLECRASMIGGAAWADLRKELGLTWEEMNETDDPRVSACARRIVDDLFDGIDLAGVADVVCAGNALAKNPALVRALESRSGRTCRLPELPEMAACGAAFWAMDGESR